MIILVGEAGYSLDTCEAIFDKQSQSSEIRSHKGFSRSVFSRILKYEKRVATAIENDRPLEISNDRVIDQGRGYKRFFTPSQMRSKSSKAQRLYRGLNLSAKSRDELLSRLRFDSKFMTSGEFAHVGDVVWVSKDIDEAAAYAMRSSDSEGTQFNAILEIEVPKFMYFERSKNEGFLLPEHFRSLKNFLVRIHIERARYEWRYEYSFDPEPTLMRTESQSEVIDF